MIKAIETIYPYPNGPKYRSRLEARWAVYFDVLGIKYEYEMEGFELAKGIWYLPDFYLPQIDCYVEVKPKIPEFDSNEALKPFLFGTLSGNIYLVSDGAPNNLLMYVGFEYIKYGNLASINVRKDGQPCVLLSRQFEEEEFDGFFDIGLESLITEVSQLQNYDLDRVRKAHTAAVQYRFERPKKQHRKRKLP